MLRNIVKSLPDSIGDLANLDMLSLPNNLSLTKLPESLSKISNLSFINLRNSNKSIEIPESLASKLNDEGDGFYFVS
jgi:Leucine-rich repeat (LRR) protein